VARVDDLVVDDLMRGEIWFGREGAASGREKEVE